MAQPRSQPSQQSFSQGFSSQQNGMFSQISQSSLDEVLTENQRFGSQEKDNVAKRISSLAPISYPREESQMPMSRSSANLSRRWSSASVPDHKFQLSDELEHRIAMMETSLSRFGMVLDSVQADVMQVNKGTKQLSLDVESLRQKAIVHDDSFHQLNRGLEDIRASLDVGFKSINDQLSKITQKDKLEQIQSEILILPERIDTFIHKRNDELSECLSGDLQVTGADSSSQKSPLRREAEPKKVSIQAPLPPKLEVGNWMTVKAEKVAFTNTSARSCKNLKQRRASAMNIKQKLVIQLDEESDGDHSCFILENNSDKINSRLMDEVNEETARILKLARRRKRRQNIKRSMPTYRK